MNMYQGRGKIYTNEDAQSVGEISSDEDEPRRRY